jgi:uncharacterized RDD family membrane protein YckC
MGSAQRDLLPVDEAPEETGAPFALKEQVAQRLAAHRARRTPRVENAAKPITTSAQANSRTSRVAAAVAERYANSQSYRAFLAEQAESAIREAEAAAEVAALSAQAVADAQYQLLAELDQWNLTPPPAPVPAPAVTAQPQLQPQISESISQLLATPPPTSGLTVRLYDADQVGVRSYAEHNGASGTRQIQNKAEAALDETEVLALEEEIAFRQAPVFDDPAVAPIDIPANLIEFPRQLVAARKARPRLAEGPLREEADQAVETAQLRIFEVEATQISTAPVVESATPEWSSILLEAHPAAAVVEVPEAPFQQVFSPQTAPFSLRAMAAIVDGCVIGAALLAFTAAFAITVGKLAGPATAATGSRITLQTAAIAGAATFIVFTMLYQLLFFTLSTATPGMRYARIAFCTFNDDNPTRAAMRRRIFATLLSACPLGIGFLWAWLDDDGLGWHDRISRMYQRSY